MVTQIILTLIWKIEPMTWRNWNSVTQTQETREGLKFFFKKIDIETGKVIGSAGSNNFHLNETLSVWTQQ